MPERPRKARSPPEGAIGTAASTAPSRRGDARQRLVPLMDPVAVLGSSKPIPVIVTDVPTTPVTGRRRSPPARPHGRKASSVHGGNPVT